MPLVIVIENGMLANIRPWNCIVVPKLNSKQLMSHFLPYIFDDKVRPFFKTFKVHVAFVLSVFLIKDISVTNLSFQFLRLRRILPEVFFFFFFLICY